jgi:hypothetical protein
MKRPAICGLFILLLAAQHTAQAQHLGWRTPIEHATFLYGEMVVLASGPDIYYCGAGWGGAYSGIQELYNSPKLMIFSVWDTSPKLHPRVVQWDERTEYTRFGGEGTGAGSHMNYP